ARGVVGAAAGTRAAWGAGHAARAGVPGVVLTPGGAIAPAKQAQARAVGARVLEVRGSFDDALRACLELTDFTIVNSLNPYRLEGQKTAVFEIAEQLGRAPDVLALPYGGGGNTCAYARGFAEEGGATRLVCGQAAERAETVASAIRIAEPAHLQQVEAIVAAGRAEIVSVRDEEITDAWLEVSSREGIFCEPSSAAGLAALSHVELEPGSTVVCVLTGHGLKDTAAVDVLTAAATLVDATPEAILAEVRR